MRFFFVDDPPPELTGPWSPPGYLLRHLKALRLSREEQFLLLLPQGGAVLARMAGPGSVELRGLTEMPRLGLLPVTLATAWPKGTRADQLVVRATEAGVERIVPLICERSVAGREALGAERLERLTRLARETCQQCGRPVPPVIDAQPVALEEVEREAPVARPVALVPGSWPLAMELTLHRPRELLLIVGPEGGFTPGEVAWFEARGITKAGLLPTVLRVESAGPLAVAVCQHWYAQLPSR